jgi:uncharacterized protein YodC (DUF2158 family)
MAQELKVGDVVQLNSGGPKMTVAALQSEGAVRCVWFSPDGKPESAVFPPSALRASKGKK